MTVCLVNLVYLDPKTNGGMSRVAREFCSVLLELAVENPSFHPVFAVPSNFVGSFHTWIGKPTTVLPVQIQVFPRPILRGLNPDLIVSPLFGVEPFDQIDEFKNVRHIVMMPDALSLDKPELFPPQIIKARQQTYELLKQAYRIVTLSNFARDRLLYHLNMPVDSIVAIPLGADAVSKTTEVQSKLKIEEFQPYLFYPANTWPHKRHELLMKVFQQVLQKRPEMHLVLTGGRFTEFGIDLSKLISKYSLPPQLVYDLGYVSDEDIGLLYRNAEALVFTSEHEGFGIPIVEAMRFECPVICAPLTSLPEVADNAVLYVHSDDPQEWASVIVEELPLQRSELVKRGLRRARQLTWEKTRAQYRLFLLDVVPDVFASDAAPTYPAVALPMVIQEINSGIAALDSVGNLAANAQLGTSSQTTDLPTSLQYLESLLEQEYRSPLARIPVIGYLLRALIRLRNIGRFWRVSNIVALEIVRRQAALAAQIEALGQQQQ